MNRLAINTIEQNDIAFTCLGTLMMLTMPIAAPKTLGLDLKQILYCSSCWQHLSRPQKIIVQLKTVNYFQSKQKCTRISCPHWFLFFYSNLLFTFSRFYCWHGTGNDWKNVWKLSIFTCSFYEFSIWIYGKSNGAHVFIKWPYLSGYQWRALSSSL